MDLEQTLTSRDNINGRLRGAAILSAEGQRQPQILTAEGDKQPPHLSSPDGGHHRARHTALCLMDLRLPA